MATEMFIDLEINNRLKDQLIQLKKNYLLYDKRNILKLRSKFAVRIYQLLKSNERRDSENVISIFTVKDLREMLLVDDDGVPTNQYKKYFLFKKKVLFIAQEQINEHTDISFTFEEIKKGRRIDSIKFFVRKNRKASKQKDSVKSELINSESLEEWVIPESEQSPVYQKLIGVGITSDGANLLIGLYGNDELLLSELKFAQKKLESSINVKNPAGFIYKSIERQEFQKSELIRKQAEQKAKTKKQSEAELIKTHTAKIKELRAEYTVKRNEALETVVNDYTKAKRKKEIDKRLEGQLFLRKAYKKAVEKKNKADEIDLTCSLFGPELEVSNLDTFENYILHEYSYVLRDQGRHKIIMKSK